MAIAYSIIALLAVLTLAYTEARQDHKAMLADGSNDSLRGKFHRQRLVKRALFCAGFGLALVFDSWLLYLAYLPLAALLYWIFFDGFLNVLRGLPDFYVGKTASIDKFFRKYFNQPEKAMFLIKFISAGIVGAVYVIVLIHTI